MTDSHPKNVVFRVSLPHADSTLTKVGRAWLEYDHQTTNQGKEVKVSSIKTKSAVFADRPVLDATNSIQIVSSGVADDFETSIYLHLTSHSIYMRTVKQKGSFLSLSSPQTSCSFDHQ